MKFAVFLFFFFLSWKGDEGFNRLTYNSFQPVKDVQFCSWRNYFLVYNNTLILRFGFSEDNQVQDGQASTA